MTWLEICGKNRDCSGCCPYGEGTGEDEDGRCRENLMADAYSLLKEQKVQKFFVDESGKITPLPVVVRCKDCKHYFNGCCYSRVSNRINFTVEVPDDWFCADGERQK